MTAIGLHARFPSTRLMSQTEFREFRRAAQERLDARYGYETGLITRDDTLRLAGTCAPCLRRTVFTTDTRRWQRLPDGRRLPQWDEALICDCEYRLGNRARAVVHFATAVAGLRPWTRLVLFGPADPSHRRLAQLAGRMDLVLALRHDPEGATFHLDHPDSSCDLAVAVHCLHRVPPLDMTFAELRRVLAPGGSLLFSVPFRYDSAHTVSHHDLAPPPAALARETVHEIGWDVLDRLRVAGFTEATAHCYWSAELGYLGPFNMIFYASV